MTGSPDTGAAEITDEDRTTAIGLARYAYEYLEAAILLDQTIGASTSISVTFRPNYLTFYVTVSAVSSALWLRLPAWIRRAPPESASVLDRVKLSRRIAFTGTAAKRHKATIFLWSVN